MAFPIYYGPGFVVEWISSPPPGPIEAGSAYFGIPDALPRPPVSLGDPLAERYGRDLRMERGDLVLEGNGDLVLTGGLEALREAIARAIVTTPGEMSWRPTFGVGATDFVGRPASTAHLSSLRTRIENTLLSNLAVDAVEVGVEQGLTDGALIQVTTIARVAGQATRVDLQIRPA